MYLLHQIFSHFFALAWKGGIGIYLFSCVECLGIVLGSGSVIYDRCLRCCIMSDVGGGGALHAGRRRLDNSNRIKSKTITKMSKKIHWLVLSGLDRLTCLTSNRLVLLLHLSPLSLHASIFTPLISNDLPRLPSPPSPSLPYLPYPNVRQSCLLS